jgi:putative ABC transport system permease protein
MLAVTLRGILARKLRTALTAIAIVLGVAMISGTYVLTDTIDQAFDKLSKQTAKGVDVQLSSKTEFGDNTEQGEALTADVLGTVQGAEGVDFAEGLIYDQYGAPLIGRNGKALDTHGAPTFAGSWPSARFNPFKLIEGTPPEQPTDVVIDSATAGHERFKVGDKVQVVGPDGKESFTVSGILTLGEVTDLGAATVAAFTLPTAQRITDKRDRFDNIFVAVRAGETPAAVKDSIAKVVPPTIDVRTNDEFIESQNENASEFTAFIGTTLLFFGYVALFVGAFIILNTLWITVAQRTRDFALLRTLGASRKQVLGSVVVESLVIGLLASAVGLALGFLLAKGLQSLLTAIGLDLPTTGTVFLLRTVIVAVIAGTVVTLVAGLLPAIRASRVAPVVALRDDPPSTGRRGKVGTIIGAVFGVAGLGLIGVGLFGGGNAEDALPFMGLGALTTFIGVALLAPLLIRPLTAVIGYPMEATAKIIGRVATRNAVRNPGRTALTAAALMIGLALVTFVTIFASALKDTFSSTVQESLKADLTVQSKNFNDFPPSARRAVAGVPGVETVASTRFGDVRFVKDKSSAFLNGVDIDSFAQVYELNWVEGNDELVAQLGPRDAIIEQTAAEDEAIKVGDTITLETPAGKTVDLTVRGIYDDKSLLGDSLFSGVTVRADTYRGALGEDKATQLFINVADGARTKDVKNAIAERLENRYPILEVKTKREFIDTISGFVDRILALFYGLLGLSIIISLFGIVNTLVLSIFERTREFGMLRAVGGVRGQLWGMVTFEAIIVAVIGAVLGIVVGLGFGEATVYALRDEGMSLTFPIVPIVIFLLLAIVAGLFAAILPSMRVTRMRVLDAIAEE